MISISPFAEGCKTNPTAPSNNLTAPIESVQSPLSTTDGSGVSNKRHSFSRKLAREIQQRKRVKNSKAKHGAHEAIVLKYLANRVRESRKCVGGKQWYYATVRDLQTRFPYLTKSTIGEIIRRLKELGYCEIERHNLRKYDRTFWYHVPEKVRHAAEDDVIYFESATAQQVGVVAAVIHSNFSYWIGKCEEGVKMSPADLRVVLPFSVDAIKRAIKTLVRG